MSRAPAAELVDLLDAALAGEPGGLRSFLRDHSHLPGPRGNLELAGDFADLVAGRAGGSRGPAVWRLVESLASVGPEEAPTGDPGEFLAFCGTVGAAAFAGDGKRRSGMWRVVRRAAEDPRWRLREAAAQAIQRALPADPAFGLATLEDWAARGGWLLLRAVAAGLADPPLLARPGFAGAGLRLHAAVLERFAAAANRRDPGFRVLRQGLGFSLSVVVAAAPDEGFELLCRLARSPDPDLAWVLRSNLGKSRLARAHPAEVAQVHRLLAG